MLLSFLPALGVSRIWNIEVVFAENPELLEAAFRVARNVAFPAVSTAKKSVFLIRPLLVHSTQRIFPVFFQHKTRCLMDSERKIYP